VRRGIGKIYWIVILGPELEFIWLKGGKDIMCIMLRRCSSRELKNKTFPFSKRNFDAICFANEIPSKFLVAKYKKQISILML
jgi:hypothetical protein